MPTTTQEFLEKVKNAPIELLIEADKASAFRGKDGKLSSKELESAINEGLLNRTSGPGNSVFSSLSSDEFVTRDQAKQIIEDIGEKYPDTVKGGKLDFKALKAEIDPEYKKIHDQGLGFKLELGTEATAASSLALNENAKSPEALAI